MPAFADQIRSATTGHSMIADPDNNNHGLKEISEGADAPAVNLLRPQLHHGMLPPRQDCVHMQPSRTSTISIGQPPRMQNRFPARAFSHRQEVPA